MSSASDNTKSLSITQSTTISVALAVAIVAGAFTAGSKLTMLTSKIEYTQEQVKTNKEQHLDLKSLTLEVSKLAADNKRRLDIMETRITK